MEDNRIFTLLPITAIPCGADDREMFNTYFLDSCREALPASLINLDYRIHNGNLEFGALEYKALDSDHPDRLMRFQLGSQDPTYLPPDLADRLLRMSLRDLE